MRSLALRLFVLWGWRRALAAFLAGAFSALAQAPFHFFPVLFITFPVLIWLLDGIGGQSETPKRGLRSAFITGWCFGFGYFLVGLYWVGLAFLVDAAQFAWMMPFAVVMLPLGLAIFTGISTGIYYILWRPNSFRILSFAALFVLGEWLRGHLFTGFPWNLIGYSFAWSESLLQPAAVMGAYGLSFLCVLVVSCFALTAEDESASLQQKYAGYVLSAVLLGAVFVFGALRLNSASNETVPGISLRLIQPNISQKDKWNAANKSKIFAQYLRLTNKPTSPQTMGVETATHIIWPEVALPFLLLQQENALASIAAILPENKFLITGTIRSDVGKNGANTKATNSVVLMNHEAKVVGTYDKAHLVPFGEYLPLADILEPLGLRKLVSIPTGFRAGPGPGTIAVEGTPPFSPLICYEAIFPGKVTEEGGQPLWLLNLTNDAWFGDSAGPYQHFQQSRVRAIEQGLPMIRSANTGISAIIDPYGRILYSLELNKEGVLDGPLPKSLSSTPYARYGDLILLVFCIFCISLAFLRQKNTIANRQ